MALAPIDPRHTLLRVPQIHHSTRTTLRIIQGNPFVYQVRIHADCPCNELVSLCNRHLVDRTMIPFDQNLWRRATRRTLKYYPEGLAPVPYDDIISAYTGGKKRLYTRARHVLTTEGLQPKHAVVKMFVKPDRYPVDTIEAKAPRAIQYRSPEFNLEMGSYIKPYEEALYPSLTMGTISGTRVIAKGLNSYDRAELLLTKIDSFRRPAFVLIDHSQFDSTINRHHLQATHKRYQRAFKSRKLQRCLRSQLVNTGYTKHGIKYRARGTRMSGDPDTACGNSIVNAEALHAFLVESGVSKYDFLLDGDDSVVIVESADKHRLDFTLFGRLGFQTKYEVVDDLDEVEFCQSKIVLADRPVMVRNPARAMSHAAVSRRPYSNHQWHHWLAAVGSCEVASNLGVPILQEYGAQLRRLSREHLVDDDFKFRYEMYDHRVTERPVTEDARLSFALAWGVDPATQRVIESFDFTSQVYVCHWKQRSLTRISQQRYNHVRIAYARKTWAIWSSHQCTPESSRGCWWRSGETRAQCPWRGRL